MVMESLVGPPPRGAPPDGNHIRGGDGSEGNTGAGLAGLVLQLSNERIKLLTTMLMVWWWEFGFLNMNFNFHIILKSRFAADLRNWLE